MNKLNRKPLLSLKDVSIIPVNMSFIKHRSECNPFYNDTKTLPIFTSPMPCVVDDTNYEIYRENGIIPILPRTVELDKRLKLSYTTWCAFSLDEFDKYILHDTNDWGDNKRYVLIDMANGNMSKLYLLAKESKEKFDDSIVLMVGNIANPRTFDYLAGAGVDYVRCSVGSGKACTTATLLGILYPMASLISDCFEIKKEKGYTTKIIADGGLSSFRRMFKALALGADYIMLGSALASLTDSPAKTILKGECDENGLYKAVEYKEYYGMASEKGMKMLGKEGIPEGKNVLLKSTMSISEFSNRFAGLLRSLMSYCGFSKLEYFIGGPEIGVLSQNASEQFNQE